MQDPTSLFTVEPPLAELIRSGSMGDSTVQGLGLLAVFNGHLDAGQVATQVRETLLSTLDHRLLASFDADQLLDYRARRPTVSFDGERFHDYEQPTLQLHVVSDLLGRPFLLLSGPEPDFQWERFVASVLFLVEQLDVKLVALVDAMPLPVPHTRPLGVTAHGNREDLIRGLSTWSPQARMVSGISQLLEVRLDERRRGTTGYTLHVPHYVAEAAYPQAAVASLEYAGAALELMLPTDELRERGREIDRELDRQTEGSGEVTAMVEGLERNFDQHATAQSRSLLVRPGEEIPDADELGAAVEDYLNSQPRHAQSETDEHSSEAGDGPDQPSQS